MIKNDQVIKIYFSYAFKPTQNAYTLDEFQKNLKEIVNSAKTDLGERVQKIRFELDFQLSEYGGILSSELISKIQASHICIIDISDNNSNVLYELGYIHALNKRSIIIKSTKEKEKYPLPSDISGRFYLPYDSIENIGNDLVNSLKKKIEEILDSSELSLD